MPTALCARDWERAPNAQLSETDFASSKTRICLVRRRLDSLFFKREFFNRAQARAGHDTNKNITRE
jgi:hypothetical protein